MPELAASHAGPNRPDATPVPVEEEPGPQPLVPADPDPLLVHRAQRGERTAQDGLLRELQDMWFRFCLSMLGEKDLARDAVQETALRFLKGLASFRGESRLKTWALGIALNVCREVRRRRKRSTAGAGILRQLEGRRSPEQTLIAGEERSRLRALLGDLPPRQREALVLRFFEGLSVEEVARAMGCAPGTVKATVSQALQSLRQRWDGRR